MSPDEGATLAFSALQAGNAEEVIARVDALDQPALRSERPLLVARLLAWKAQAWMSQNRWEDARGAVLEAIRLAKQGGDTDGLPALRELHNRIAGSLAALQAAAVQAEADRALLALSEEELSAKSPEDRADILTRQSSAQAAMGDLEAARATAQRALAEAQSPRSRVLAWLSLARVGDGDQAIFSAWKVADDADDHNLITAVAHAARAAGVVLRPPI
ncbi:MAG TPA: hypothetical protein PLA94_07580 [Myxococcota bacterium]|nr:hypothetical protein [Myxococcota bacterium]